jgi:CubicO group peptidase (beta-lactamase class C family)
MAGAAAVEAVYPGKEWSTKQPEQVGLNAAKLKAFSDYAGGFGCVVRHGHLAYTWGDASRRMDVASAAKPVYAHFLLKALEGGRIFSLDEPVSKWEPRLLRTNPDLACKDARITWRHMANQISCYGLAEEPGTAYAYNDWQMALLFDTLFTKVYGAAHLTVDAQVLRSQLTDLIECQDDPTFLAFGVKDRAGRLGISPRDFARFGLLYLRGGKWNGRQLLSPELVRMAVTDPVPNAIPRAGTEAAAMIPGQRSIGSRRIPDNQTDHMGSYSWLWWINGVDREDKRHWPDATVDTFGCFGHGGKRAMVVLPGLDLIVSWNNTRIEGRDMETKALALLCRAVKPGGLTVDSEHPQWLARAGGRPFVMCGPGDPEDFLYRGTLNPDGTRDGDQMALIEKLKGTGANCIYLMAVRSHGGDGDQTHNPFINHDPAQGIHPKVLDQWEQWFTEMDRHGIVIYFFLYDDSARIWNTGDEVGEPERQFVETLVNRFEHHGHLIWCIAEEYSEALTAERVKKIAAHIKANDAYNHPVAVHRLNGLDFSEFADDPNIDQFAIQYNVKTAEELHAGLLQAWQDARGRYSLNLSEAADWGTGAEARQKAWACAMAGAHVMVLGMDIATTAEDDLRACGHLARFFTDVNLCGMEPRDELAHGDTQYVLAKPPSRYVLYTSHSTGHIGLPSMKPGLHFVDWLDCVSGRRERSMSSGSDGEFPTLKVPEGFAPEVAVYIRGLPE